MTDQLADERRDVLDAIERRRYESAASFAPRAELDALSPRTLRRIAALLRSAAWSDKTTSAEEAAEGFDDPGWAPNATLRVAALIDHLSELSSPSVGDVAVVPAAAPPLMPPATTTTLPVAQGDWIRISTEDLCERLATMAPDGVDVSLFDLADKACIARATSWRGEIVEIVDLTTLSTRITAQQSTLRNPGNEGKAAVKAELERLEGKRQAWSEACVRAGSNTHTLAQISQSTSFEDMCSPASDLT